MKKLNRMQIENEIKAYKIKEIDNLLTDMSDEEVENEYMQIFNKSVNEDIQMDNASDIIEERKNLID